MQVGKAIQAARDKAGLTQEQLAKLVGVTVSTVCGWETEAHSLSVDRLEVVARALGTTVAKLVR